MNFKIKMFAPFYMRGFHELPDDVDLVMTDENEDEVMYLGTIHDYAVAQEIVKRWNEYKN